MNKRSLADLLFPLLVSIAAVACSSDTAPQGGGGGGGTSGGGGGGVSGGGSTGIASSVSSGGQTGAGGTGSGGTTSAGGAGTGGASGGSSATRGSAAGATSIGGTTASGGTTRTGGASGGATGTGGSGGATATGGRSDSGGSGGAQGGSSVGGRGGASSAGGQSAGAGGSRPDGGPGGSTGAGGGTGSTYNPCPTTAGTACKILPLGDSITEGFGSSGGGYRVELFRQAVKNGKNITFVGSLTNGPTTVENKPFPPNHEGHGGWTISQIAGIADSTLSSTTPHIVLLKIGTNDVNGTGASSAPTNLKNLINQITKDSPSALLVVSSIIPIKDDNTNQKVKTYNATIPGTVNDAAAAGKHVVFADSYAAFVADSSWKTKYMSDNLHPNDTGYALLGQTFYTAISAVLP